MNKFMRVIASLVAGGAAAFAGEFDSNGVKIHYQVEGQGEPVILIHGLTANARINWQWPGIISVLAEDYQVIALDCRGHGLSGKPTISSQYGTNMVDDVVRLMDHLKIKSAHLVGYSMGGMITMKMLVHHPERVRSAVVGGMGWMREFPVLSWLPTSTNALQACVKGFGQLLVTPDQIRAIKTPFSVVIGDRDPLREGMVEPLQQLRPDVPVRIIRNAGHIDCCVKPQFKTELKAFLDKHAGSRPSP
jgi:pimeloyl-ACP methyl ester carboxylesterase